MVFPDPATHPLRDPRVRVHIEDARYFLQTTDQRFDVITGEPPPPEIAGVVNLYTREYFRLLYDRLAEGGIVPYWLPLHAINAESVKAILRAFCDVFEDCSLWHGQWLDLMMVGTRNAKGPVSETSFRRQWRDPLVFSEMTRLGLEQAEQLGALFIGDAPYLRDVTEGVQALVDDFPKRVTSTVASRLALVQLIDQWIDVKAAQTRFLQSALIKRLWPEPLRVGSLPYFHIQGILHRHWFGLRTDREPVIDDLHRVLTQSSLQTLPVWLLGSDADIEQIVTETGAQERESPKMQWQLGVRHIANRAYAEAIPFFVQAESNPEIRPEAFRLRIYALSMAGQIDQAQALVNDWAIQFLKENPQRKPTPFGARVPSPSKPTALTPFWAWMKETFGVDPLAAANQVNQGLGSLP